MDTHLSFAPFCKKEGKNLLIFFIGISALIVALPVLAPGNQMIEAYFVVSEDEFTSEEILNRIALIGENTLLPITTSFSLQPVQKMRVVITAYSSSVWETDEDPYITAAGTLVRDGIVANNLLPIGTKLRIPELYGDKIFVVEDRMHWKKSNYHIDIWFPSYWEALNFGAKRTYIEILEG